MRRLAPSLLLLAIAACTTTPVNAPVAPNAPRTIPATPLELGDRSAPQEAVLAQFEQTITARYGAGLALDAVAADLTAATFSCAANHDTTARGDPPAQICRKTITADGCTNTWQVHLFDTRGNAQLARARGLYDRRCAGEGLLGGPGG